MAKLGLFSTMTGSGSLELVTTIARACQSGEVPDAEVAFLFVNREAGESAATDSSVEEVGSEFELRVVRASAYKYEREERARAREAEKAGDNEPMWLWRESFYGTYRDLLDETDLDLLLGDMWIWARSKCAERRGLNLHPALPSGPLGKMWFDVVWDLIAEGAEESGVMLHRVTPEVDRGPVATFCRYPLRGPGLDELWAELPTEGREELNQRERRMKRETKHPLFRALRVAGLAREMPLMLATARAVAEGRLRLASGGVVDEHRRSIEGGLELTAEVEESVRSGGGA